MSTSRNTSFLDLELSRDLLHTVDAAGPRLGVQDDAPRLIGACDAQPGVLRSHSSNVWWASDTGPMKNR